MSHIHRSAETVPAVSIRPSSVWDTQVRDIARRSGQGKVGLAFRRREHQRILECQIRLLIASLFLVAISFRKRMLVFVLYEPKRLRVVVNSDSISTSGSLQTSNNNVSRLFVKRERGASEDSLSIVVVVVEAIKWY